ncbi:MAG: hypothetical protein RI571_06575 [Roseovarius sp.]|nr:hypothetical protein [Roseovarius sp.]
MSDRVVALDGGVVLRATEPNEGVISELEDLLEQAHAGRLQGFTYAALRDDGSAFRGWSGWDSPVQIGQLTLLLHEACEDRLFFERGG